MGSMVEELSEFPKQLVYNIENETPKGAYVSEWCAVFPRFVTKCVQEDLGAVEASANDLAEEIHDEFNQTLVQLEDNEIVNDNQDKSVQHDEPRLFKKKASWALGIIKHVKRVGKELFQADPKEKQADSQSQTSAPPKQEEEDDDEYIQVFVEQQCRRRKGVLLICSPTNSEPPKQEEDGDDEYKCLSSNSADGEKECSSSVPQRKSLDHLRTKLSRTNSSRSV